MIERTYIIKADEETGYSSKGSVGNRLEEVTFFCPKKIYCVDHDIPDYRFTQEYLWIKEEVEQLVRDAEKKGRGEAWAVAQKILKDTKRGGYKPSELLEIFDCASTYKCIVDNSIEEAMRKIKDWEDTFHVGDIVVLRDANPVRGVVTNIEKYADTDEPCYGVLFEDGTYGSFCSDDLEKTKEHVDLSEIFAKLKGEE